MERAEAFRTLRLDASADGTLVESAYWQLVRKAQQHQNDAAAQQEIDRLNEARDLLAPKGPPAQPMRRPVRRAESNAGDVGIAMLEAVADWVWLQALHTRMRWPGRGAEVAAIGAAGIVLMVLALGAGASVWATFGAVGVVLTAIWAPWRRVG